MARRYDHSQDEIRSMAVEAGNTIIALGGLTSLSARGVAKAIGYSVGTIHNVFGSYDLLVLHINTKTLDDLQSEIALATQETQAGAATIRTMAHTYFAFAQQHPNRWRAIFEHSLPSDASIPEWYTEKTARLFTKVESHMQVLHPHTNAKQNATALWAGVHGICILALSGKLSTASDASTASIIDTTLDHFISSGIKH